MRLVRAFVVGIERYGEPRFNVEGPGLAALEVAKWLLSLSDCTLRLDCFITPGILSDDSQSAFQRKEVTLHKSTEWHYIDNFARVHLKEDLQPGTHFFFFWAGHGFVDNNTGARMLLCGDYGTETPNRIFNFTGMSRLWRTRSFSKLTTQTLLVDACGVERGAIGALYDPHETQNIPQLIYFATPVGDWARSPLAGGRFTNIALEVLRDMNGAFWELESLKPKLQRSFAGAGPPYPECEDWNLSDSANRDTAPFYDRRAVQSAYELLVGKNWERRDNWRRQFEQVVARLAIPELNALTDLREALVGLAQADGTSVSSNRLSFALLSFMMRLALSRELQLDITNWLDTFAAGQRKDRDEITRFLEAENRQRILLIDIHSPGAKGKILGFWSHVCQTDGQFDPKYPREYEIAAGWDAFVMGLQRVIARLADANLPEDEQIQLEDLQIHFIVDTQHLNGAFHRIPSAPGPYAETLGTRCPVLLRAKSRMLSVALSNRCGQALKRLRERPPSDLNWGSINANQHPLPSGADLYYAGFVLPQSTDGGPDHVTEKSRIMRTILNDAPILYFSHDHLGDDLPAALAMILTGISRSLPQLDRFVDHFCQDRRRGERYAERGSLLWDDPKVNPILLTTGVKNN